MMKLINWAGATLAMGLTAVTFAQPEQWLQYRTSDGGWAYRWFELTTNPPPHVALPKLEAGACFARWATPFDPTGGRWLCFDRARKTGPCDRLFFDSNGNGRLDDESPAKATRVDKYSASFGALRVVLKGEDGPLSYHLALRFLKYDDGSTRLLAESAGGYEGLIAIGAKKRRVQLIDGNLNAAFNDQAANPDDCDRVLVEGDKVGERLLGRWLEIDGDFYRLEVARDGAFIKLQKADQLACGQVRVPENIARFTAVGEPGHFVREPAKGELTLPAGKYRIHGWEIDRKDDRGAAWQLSGYGFNDSASFEVTAGNPVRLEVGEPMRSVLRAIEQTNQVAFSLRFLGRYNETLQILKGNERPRGPRLTLASLDGSFRATNTFEFG